MKNLRYVIVLTTFFVSFQGLSQEPTKMQQVMVSHDEVMAKMPDLVKLVGQLQSKVDATKAGQKYQEAIDNLKTSNQSMMHWMQGFGERFSADEMMKDKALTAEKKQWLLEEEKKIKVLRKEINSSINKAKKLLEK